MNFTQFNEGFYQTLSSIVSSDRLVNGVPEPNEQKTGKGPFSIQHTPGTVAFATLAGGPLRAFASNIQGPGVNEYIWALAGPNLYIVDPLGVPTLIGTVAFSGGAQVIPAQIIACAAPGVPQNGVFVLSEGQGYYATISPPAVVPVTLPVAFARTATYMDTYVIISDVDSRDFYISAVGDPTSWNPLDVATKEGAPDFLQGVYATQELLFLVGLETTEIWYDSGAANFPFQRYPGGGVLQIGTTDPYSIQKVGDAVMWVARSDQGDNFIVMLRGLQYQRVSNFAIEAMLGVGATGAGIAYSYEENGHFFYILNSAVIPGGIDTTLGYDMSSNQWHERGLLDTIPVNGPPTFHRQNWQYHVMGFFASGAAAGHYVGGTGVGTDTQAIIYRQQMNIFDYAGLPKVVMRIAPHIISEEDRLRIDHYVLDNDKTSASVINLLWSLDGGQTWGNTHTRTSPSGQSRTIWRQLGSARDRVFCQWSQTACKQVWAAVYINEMPPAR